MLKKGDSFITMSKIKFLFDITFIYCFFDANKSRKVICNFQRTISLSDKDKHYQENELNLRRGIQPRPFCR